MDLNKRAPVRNHYKALEDSALLTSRHTEQVKQLQSLENTVLTAIASLVRFMDGKTTKTEVVNQLKSIATPDVEKVVKAVEKLDQSVLTNKIDLKPLEDLLKGVRREVSLIPKEHAKQEKVESVKVSNLSEVKLDVSSLEKAIKALKLDPTIDVKAPVVSVDAPDLKPIQDVMLDLLKAVRAQKYPEFPKIPETDLSKVEKKLDESNKHLKKLVDKPVGGGGGGGNGTPYTDDVGTPKNVVLDNGAIPVTSGGIASYQVNDIEESTTSYFGFSTSAGEWMIKALTDTSVSYATVSNNGTVTSYTDAWTDRATLTYGRYDEAF